MYVNQNSVMLITDILSNKFYCSSHICSFKNHCFNYSYSSLLIHVCFNCNEMLNYVINEY